MLSEDYFSGAWQANDIVQSANIHYTNCGGVGAHKDTEMGVTHSLVGEITCPNMEGIQTFRISPSMYVACPVAAFSGSICHWYSAGRYSNCSISIFVRQHITVFDIITILLISIVRG